VTEAMTDISTANVYRHDFPTAFRAIRKLLADPDDTTQVFLIMRALNGPTLPKCFARMNEAPAGRRQVYARVELAERFADPAFIASFAPGTVGAAYRSFLAETGYSATGLVEVSKLDREPLLEDSYEWCRRRVRDVHDIWHVLTGYKADESLGEATLVAFSYAQTGGLGWAFIALAAALKSLRVTRNTAFARAVSEGYRLGRKSKWLLIEDYEALLHEPLSAARERLRIGEPAAYREAQTKLGVLLATNS
jgi:ubiquinone biosynthesis protein COQ4